MIFKQAPLSGAFEIHPEIREDERGYFYRFFCKNEFDAAGLENNWVQINHSFTREKGTIRGMHYQLPPFTEVKFLRCVAGKIFDVIIDLRKDSPTFLQYFGTELSAENRNMLYIPKGFAHGFQALTDNCGLIYHHSEFFTPGAEGGIRFDDPLTAIQWPLPVTQLSVRDQNHPYLEQTFGGIKL